MWVSKLATRTLLGAWLHCIWNSGHLTLMEDMFVPRRMSSSCLVLLI